MTLSAQVALKRIGDHLSSQSPHHIPSPPHQPRRACVALILRWYTKRPDLISSNKLYPKTIQEFYELPWVKQDPKGELEILFMQRATRSGDRWSGHVAYIGGKNEPGETDFDTVTREVKEEIGLNLNSESFLHLGQLDDREITSIWDRKLMMILIPFVFLQVVPYTPTMQLEKDEVASVEWIPFSFFLSPTTDHSTSFAEESLTPRVMSGWRRTLLQPFLGTITFPAIDLPVNDLITSTQQPRRFRLWGLTLGMTRDLVQLAAQDDPLSFLTLVAGTPRYSRKDIGWWTQWIAKMTLFWRHRHSSKTIISKSRQRAEWDKIYYESLRTGVITAVIARVVVLAFGLSWLVRYRRRFIR